ncbi:MAG: NAD(P)-dependent oxidoreductase [bacterium]
MSSCVIFGGSGFVGSHLTRHFLKTGRFDRIHLADIQPSPLDGTPGVSYSHTDVRERIELIGDMRRADWIFNLAAVHREPGHEPEEYYQTNVAGAKNVCDFADRIGCSNMYFTSSIAVYGPTQGPTTEDSPFRPATPYGGSKYAAETIKRMWRRQRIGRRLLISRPGVLYGPGDTGNIMRMIRAIKKGYFAYPGSSNICKSYGYILGLLDSVDFLIDGDHNEVIYNYVETPTQPLSELVDEIKKHLQCRALVAAVPMSLLLPISRAVQVVLGAKNPIHPVRVQKAATPTYIIPQVLLNMGFQFKYPFCDSLRHWEQVAPEDFGLPISSPIQVAPQRLCVEAAVEGRRSEEVQHQ